jgi:hypothetical protein
LPTLLQGFDSVNTQGRCRAELTRFVDQGLTAFNAGFLCGFQADRRGFENNFPLPLHFAKGFLAQVSGIAPTVGKLVQGAQLATPVLALCIH